MAMPNLTINEFIDLGRPDLNRRAERLKAELRQIRSEESGRTNADNYVARVFERTTDHFEEGVKAAFGLAKWASANTSLNPQDLRQTIGQLLLNFTNQIKALIEPDTLKTLVGAKVVNDFLGDLDRRLQFLARQNDQGILDLGGLQTPPAPSTVPQDTRPYQPDPSHWGDTSEWYQSRSRLIPAAVLDGGDSRVLPLPELHATFATEETPDGTNITLDTSNGALAAETRASVSFRDHAEAAEKLAEALSRQIKREVERLESAGHNEPAWQDEIDFLKFVSSTLDQIAMAIRQARQAATPDAQAREFAEAETLASKLAKAGRDFAERNYERVIDYGCYSTFVILGTPLFVNLFGVPATEALLAQLALLGLSSKKSN
jgi:ribosome-associated translation inhibitor RaiA